MTAILYPGSIGFWATANYSGSDYNMWVSLDGAVIIGSLPDDSLPKPGETADHRHDGRMWLVTTLSAFMYQTT